MNWYQVEGEWKKITASVRRRWGKLTDDDLDLISGKHHELRGKLQERYGITREQAKQEMKEWIAAPEGGNQGRMSY
jgi:uncharacterized protein YjbJ (UPF0337 family)